MKLEKFVFIIIAAYGLILAGMERPETGDTLFGLGIVIAACIATSPERLRIAMIPLFAMKLISGAVELAPMLHSEMTVPMALALGEVASAIAIGAVYARLRWAEKVTVSEPVIARPVSLSTTLRLIPQESTSDTRLLMRK